MEPDTLMAHRANLSVKSDYSSPSSGWIKQEISWVSSVMQWRINHPSELLILEQELAPPDFGEGKWGDFLTGFSIEPKERLILSTLLAVSLENKVMAPLNLPGNPARLSQYGQTGALLPTAETLLYLLGGSEPEMRLAFRHVFQADHVFYKKSVIEIEEVPRGVSEMEGVTFLRQSWLELFILNQYRQPRFSQEFPAHLLTTNLSWNDLILNESTEKRLAELKNWLAYAGQISADPKIGRHYRPGYRCLFYGPSGTGKTLAATLLGQHLGREVYRVDLSAVISKYIGETSKNLNELFNRAEDKDWILFFDEGDALFARRSKMAENESKNAAFANQDVAFLLQRMEVFNGLLIVATNFEKNVDPAFSRRFNQLVPFEQPDPANALRLWKENWPSFLSLAPEMNLEAIVQRHALSAASIVNVLQRVAVLTLSRGTKEVNAADMNRVILDELYNQKNQ